LSLRIEEIKPDRLSEYGSIPMRFEVHSIFIVEEIEKGLGGLRFREEKVEKPYIKDYDSYEDLYADNEEEETCSIRELGEKGEVLKAGSPWRCEATSWGKGPERWLRQFDVSNWGFLVVFDGDKPLAGATIAYNTDNVHMLEGRSDLAVLWDIRVHPDYAGQGIGSMLFNHAVEWARRKGCTQLKIETQNVNVPACRFYTKQGCHLGQIHRYAYRAPWAHPRVRNEVMLIWYLDL
jgi:GNAT superfamily N-acetyltransferase